MPNQGRLLEGIAAIRALASHRHNDHLEAASDHLGKQHCLVTANALICLKTLAACLPGETSWSPLAPETPQCGLKTLKSTRSWAQSWAWPRSPSWSSPGMLLSHISNCRRLFSAKARGRPLPLQPLSKANAQNKNFHPLRVCGLGFSQGGGKGQPRQSAPGSERPRRIFILQRRNQPWVLALDFKMQMLFSKCRYLESELLPSWSSFTESWERLRLAVSLRKRLFLCPSHPCPFLMHCAFNY